MTLCCLCQNEEEKFVQEPPKNPTQSQQPVAVRPPQFENRRIQNLAIRHSGPSQGVMLSIRTFAV